MGLAMREMGDSPALTARHWQVIHYLRACYETRRDIPTVYETCSANDLSLEELRELVALERRTAEDYLERSPIGDLCGIAAFDRPLPTPKEQLEDQPRPPPVEGWDRYHDLELVAAGGMGEDGIKPTYMITKAMLEKILT